ncbi:MAG: hypothetical protein OEW11_05565 [Nitrospirota bacterium]|nr:hypothetical protein [Nitrospirota bacterium]
MNAEQPGADGLLRQLQAGIRRCPALHGTPVTGGNLSALLSSLLKHAPRPFVLVIDRMERAHLDLYPILADLAKNAPQGVFLVLVSRMPPPRTFGGLRRSGRLRVISWRHLRLTRREASSVARAWGWARPSTTQVDRLLADSGGWVGGFVFMMDQLRNSGGTGHDAGRGALAAYFTSGVLAGLGDAAMRVTAASTEETDSGPLDARHWPWRVRVQTLGVFSVEGPGVKTDGSGLRNPRGPIKLLQLLVASGPEGQTQEQLIAALWPESGGLAGMRALGTTLHRLRRLLDCDNCVERQQGRLRLNPAQVWVDAWVFERRLEQAASTTESGSGAYNRLVDEALSLYRGPFLSGSPVPWGEPLRGQLHARYVRHLAERARKWEQSGEWQQVERLYLAGIQADPLCEPFCRGLMVAHIHQGRSADAAATYERLIAALDRTHGVSPSEETRSLYAQLKMLR